MSIKESLKNFVTPKKKPVDNYEDLLITNEWDCTYVDYDAIPSENLVKKYVDQYNINTNCASACVVCQITHIEKYKGKVKPGEKPFQVDCSFIPKSYEPPPEIAKELTQEEVDLYRAWSDPVEWAKRFLGWKARPHQKIMLRCTAKRVVERCGRRSGKSEVNAVRAVFRAFTQNRQTGEHSDGTPILEGPKLMVITPFLSQITEFFDKVNNLLKRNEYLWAESHNPKGRFVKSPYHRMEISNGAELAGLTTGSSSGSDASTLRGLGANDLYFDEADFMKEGDFKAVLPILHENRNQTARASSTPKGSRSKYYDWCMNSPDWKEFYFPSTVLENWKEVEKSVKAEHSEAEIMQEYMCAFMAQDVGVYQPQYINHAYASPQFQYGELGYNPACVYSVGVDWNSSVGTEICVTALDENKRDIWVVECTNVPKQGWTQLAGIEKIVDINRRWKPKFIYVDSGGSGGETSYELLRAYGKSMFGAKGGEIDSRLFEIVKSYEFGSKIEIRDPATGQIEKKPAKDFMVQSSVRLFEEGRIHIPYDEEILKKQLFNYIIDKVNVNNQRVYGMNNPKIGDHRLDAFNLALVGYKLELSDFSVRGPNVVTTVLYGGAPGERYGQKMVSQNNPGLVDVDIRYPDNYMEYNINIGMRERRRPDSRTKGMGEKSDGPIQPGVPVYNGSNMMELRPGFSNDTENLERRKSQRHKVKRSPRSPSIRRNI